MFAPDCKNPPAKRSLESPNEQIQLFDWLEEDYVVVQAIFKYMRDCRVKEMQIECCGVIINKLIKPLMH